MNKLSLLWSFTIVSSPAVFTHGDSSFYVISLYASLSPLCFLLGDESLRKREMIMEYEN